MRIEECLEVQAIRVKRAYCGCGGEMLFTGATMIDPVKNEQVYQHRCKNCGLWSEWFPDILPLCVPETIKLPCRRPPFNGTLPLNLNLSRDEHETMLL